MRGKGVSVGLLVELVMRQTARIAIRPKERVDLFALVESLFSFDFESHQRAFRQDDIAQAARQFRALYHREHDGWTYRYFS